MNNVDASSLIPAIPGLEMEAARRHVNGDETLLRTLLTKFCLAQKEIDQQIVTALQSADMETAQRLIHTLKGVSATIGANTLSACAKAFEENMAQEGRQSLSSPLFSELSHQLRATIDTITRTLPRLETDSTARQQETVPQETLKGRHAMPENAEEKSPDETQQPDPALLTPLFQQAATLLEHYDSDIDLAMETLRSHAVTSKMKREILAIGEEVSRYDFEKALTLLQHLADDLGIAMQKGKKHE